MSIAPGHLFREAPASLTDVRRQITKATREFQAFIGNHQTQLADQLGILPQTVQSWFKEDRISVWGADRIGKLHPQFPRERLRPDVPNWTFALRAARAPQRRKKA